MRPYKTKRVFVVEEGEEFDILIEGLSHLIDGGNHNFKSSALGNRTYSYVVRNYHAQPLTVVRLTPPKDAWDRVIEEDYR